MGLLEELQGKPDEAPPEQLDLVSIIQKREDTKPKEKLKPQFNKDDDFNITLNNPKDDYHYYYCKYNCDTCHTTFETDETLTPEQVKCKNCEEGTLKPFQMNMKSKTAYEKDGVVNAVRQTDEEVDKLPEIKDTNDILNIIKER